MTVEIFIAILTLIATIYIPKKIKWEQAYSALINEYRSYDYAIACQGLVEFFTSECKNNTDLIHEKYKIRYINEVLKKKGCVNKENCLHFQRRLLAQFYWQLNECSKWYAIGRRRVKKDFSASEANMVKILMYIGFAIEDDPILFKDISCDSIVPRPEHLKGQNKALSEMYKTLKKCKRYMDV